MIAHDALSPFPKSEITATAINTVATGTISLFPSRFSNLNICPT